MDNKKAYNKVRHDSKELVYMYGKICNMDANTFIGKYKVLKYLGKGGFGIVYKCFDSVLKTEVAIKFLDPIITRDEKKFHRIKREINISRKITDDRIVKIYSMEKYYDVIFLVMEFIEGVPLSDKLKIKTYEWDEFLPILTEILYGLKHLHKKNIIHRDLKPGNIMLLKDGSIKIVDFGLAKEISDTERTSMTEEFSGTAEFVSPEQIQGEEIDERSDIYQVGIVVFKVLSGQHPFTSSSTMELLVKYLTVKPKKISTIKKDLPDYAKFLIGKMLERNKNDRFKNIDEIIDLLEKKNVGMPTQIASLTKNNKMKIVLGSLFFVFISLLVFFSIYNSKEIGSISTNKSEIIARNKINKELWKNDFSPDTIIKSFNTPVSANDLNIKITEEKNLIVCLLKNHDNKILSNSSSINSVESDNKIAIMKNDGTVVIEESFTDYFNLQSYGNTKIFNLKSKILNKDLNKDGKEDILFTAGNAFGQYPYGLVYIKDSKPLVYTNPGAFSYEILRSDDKSLSFTVYGFSNLISGLKIFAEVTLKDSNVYANPNQLPNDSQNFDGFTFYLPTDIKIINDHWKEKGTIKFIDKKSGEYLTINKNYNIQIEKKGVKTIYSDPLSKLKKFNILITGFYKERTLYKNYLRAHRLINELIDMKFENPYLNSALYYLRGDVEILKGDYTRGESSLNKGLSFYPNNPRIEARICEIPFLKGNPLMSIETHEKHYSSSEYFWGLANGTNLFKVLMYYSANLETKAVEFMSKMINNSKNMEYSLIPLGALFNGKLDEAEKKINIGLANIIPEFSIVDYRLLASRIYILNNSRLDRAKFFLEDILKHSSNYSYLSEISLAYLLAKDKKLKEAERMADLSINKVIKYAKGDFSTKLWLFYEYYIYGRTMEIVGNKIKAVKGYNGCINESPDSYLSKLSRLRLSVLKSDIKK